MQETEEVEAIPARQVNHQQFSRRAPRSFVIACHTYVSPRTTQDTAWKRALVIHECGNHHHVLRVSDQQYRRMTYHRQCLIHDGTWIMKERDDGNVQ